VIIVLSKKKMLTYTPVDGKTRMVILMTLYLEECLSPVRREAPRSWSHQRARSVEGADRCIWERREVVVSDTVEPLVRYVGSRIHIDVIFCLPNRITEDDMLKALCSPVSVSLSTPS